MSGINNGWNEWSRHVLAELERLNASYQQISSDVSDLKAKVMNYDPEKLTRLEIEVQSLQSSDADQEVRLRKIEQKAAIASVNVGKIEGLEKTIGSLERREAKMSGKWAVLAIIGAAVVSAVVGFIFKAFASSASPAPEKKVDTQVIKQTLAADKPPALREAP